MKFQSNVSLKQFSSMRLGGRAKHLVRVQSKKALTEAVRQSQSTGELILVLGEGSNTVFTDRGFSGLVIVNQIKDIEVVSEDTVSVGLRAGGGEHWDDLVAFACGRGLSGVECLTAIPGTVGAAPVQNIGAYGQEMADTFVELEAYDATARRFIVFSKEQCKFGYRASIFKSNHPDFRRGRFSIVSVTMRLSKQSVLKRPLYPTLQRFADQKSVSDFSPAAVRVLLQEWRSQYLPNPKDIPNNGSFFSNPLVTKAQLDEIIKRHPEITKHETAWYWQQPDGRYKVAAGRLAETAGLKDWHDAATGMATWKNQALVLVNEHARSYADLAAFKQKYVDTIKKEFGITFKQEPELIDD